MSFVIRGVGTALPAGVVTQGEALAAARVLSHPDLRDADWLKAVYLRSGIDTRHQVLGRGLVEDLTQGSRTSGSVFLPNPTGKHGLGPTTGQRMELYARNAPALAVEAGRKGLQQAGWQGHEVSHLVTVSCTGFDAPGVDLTLIDQLQLPPTVLRTHVGFMGCHGAMNGLRVAEAFSRIPKAKVLLVAVELCSLHYHYGPDADKAVANAIFADGAAAVAGERQSNITGHWQIADTGSCVIPRSEAAMGWRIGDHGFEMTMDRSIPRLIIEHLRPWLDRFLDDNGLSVEGVGSWAIHPGGPKILSAVEEALVLPGTATVASREVYRRFGNMSSPTVLFVIDRLRRDGAGLPCLSLGFGPGLVAEAVLWV